MTVMIMTLMIMSVMIMTVVMMIVGMRMRVTRSVVRVPRIEHVNATAVSLIVVLMVHMAVPVGTRFGLEAGADRPHGRAQALDHCPQHMIGQQPQPARADLQRHVAIADVIRDASQCHGIGGANLKELFRRGLHRHHPTVVEQQAVAVTQQGASGQVNTDLFATEQGGAKAGTLALLEGQFDDRVGGAIA